MKTKLNLVLAFGLALAGVAAGCDDEDDQSPFVDGGSGGSGGTLGTGGNRPGTGGTNPDGGLADGGGDANPSFGAFVIDLIKNKTNESGSPESLEGKAFEMSDDIGTFVELLK